MWRILSLCLILTATQRSRDHSVKDGNLMLSALHNEAICYQVENPRFVPPNKTLTAIRTLKLPGISRQWEGHELPHPSLNYFLKSE